MFSLQSIANWLFFRDNIKEAITRPRLHCQLFPPTVVYEPTFPAELIPKLQSYSHAYVTNSTYDVSGMKSMLALSYHTYSGVKIVRNAWRRIFTLMWRAFSHEEIISLDSLQFKDYTTILS